MSSTPVWVPLVVAGLGVAGTLGGTFFTRRWADRREDQRWGRDREAEEMRWHREQENRRKQWQREDGARWLNERRAIYAEYLLSISVWTSALWRAESDLSLEHGIPNDLHATLSHLEEQANRVYQTITLLAPRRIVELSAACLLNLGLWSNHLMTEGNRHKINLFTGKGDDFNGDSAKYQKWLRDAIRLDLGVDPDATLTLKPTVDDTP